MAGGESRCVVVIVKFVLECPSRKQDLPEEHTAVAVQGEFVAVVRVWAETVSLGWKCPCGTETLVEKRYILDGQMWRPVSGKDWPMMKVEATLEKVEGPGGCG